MRDVSSQLRAYAGQLEAGLATLDPAEVMEPIHVPSATSRTVGDTSRRTPRWAFAALVVMVAAVAAWLVGNRSPEVTEEPPAVTSTTLGSVVRPLAPTGVEVVVSSFAPFSFRLVTDSSGAIWSPDGGVSRFDPETGEVRTWTVADDLLFAGVGDLIPASGGGVWLYGSVLVRFDSYGILDEIAVPGRIVGLTDPGDGSLWGVIETATGDGLQRLMRWNGVWEDAGLPPAAALLDFPQWLVVTDQAGDVWVSRGRDLNLYHDGEWVADLPRPSFDRIAWIVAHSDGTITVLDPSGRMARGDRFGFDVKPGPELGGNYGTLVAAVVDADDSIWATFCDLTLGVSGPLLTRYRDGGWTIEQRLDAEAPCGAFDVAGAPQHLASGGLWRLTTEGWVAEVVSGPAFWSGDAVAVSDDEFWATDGLRVFHYAAGNHRVYDATDGIPGQVRRLAAGPLGTVWIATDAGVAVFTGDRWELVDGRPASAIGWDGGDAVLIALSGEPQSSALIATVVVAGERWVVAAEQSTPLWAVDAITAAGDGSLWIGGSGSFALFPGVARLADGAWETGEQLDLPELTLVGDLATAGDGTVWVLAVDSDTPQQVSLFGSDGTGTVVRSVLDGDRNSGFPLQGGRFQRTADGNLYLALFDGRLLVRDRDQWREVDQGELGAVSGFIRVAPDGSRWEFSEYGTVRER